MISSAIFNEGVATEVSDESLFDTQSVVSLSASVIGAIGAHQIVDDESTDSDIAVSALDEAAAGALAGSAFGPYGAAIGGTVGFVSGFLGGSSKRDEARRKREMMLKKLRDRKLDLIDRQQKKIEVTRKMLEKNLFAGSSSNIAEAIRDQVVQYERRASSAGGNVNNKSLQTAIENTQDLARAKEEIQGYSIEQTINKLDLAAGLLDEETLITKRDKVLKFKNEDKFKESLEDISDTDHLTGVEI